MALFLTPSFNRAAAERRLPRSATILLHNDRTTNHGVGGDAEEGEERHAQDARETDRMVEEPACVHDQQRRRPTNLYQNRNAQRQNQQIRAICTQQQAAAVEAQIDNEHNENGEQDQERENLEIDVEEGQHRQRIGSGQEGGRERRRRGSCNRFLEDLGNKIFSESALKFHLLLEWLCCLLVLLIISEKNNSEIIFFTATVIAISLLLSVIGLLSDAPKMLYPFVFVMLAEFILSMTLMMLTFLRQSDQNLFKMVINHVPEFDRLFGFLFRLPQWLGLLIFSICAVHSYTCVLTAVSVIPKIELRTAQERLIRHRLAGAYNMGMMNPDGLMHGPYVHIVQNDGPQFVSENPDSPPHYSVLTDPQKTPSSGKSPSSSEKRSDKDETAPPRYSQLETLFRNGRFRRQKQTSANSTHAPSACRVPGRLRMFLSSSPRKNEPDISAKSETFIHDDQQLQPNCQNAEGGGNPNSCSSTLTPCTPQNNSRKDEERDKQNKQNEHNQRQSSSPPHPNTVHF